MRPLRAVFACEPEVWRAGHTCTAARAVFIRLGWAGTILWDLVGVRRSARAICSIFVMLFKNKGSSDDCSKYRMICLLPHAYKMLSTVLLHRLRLECEGFLNECQAEVSNSAETATRNTILTSDKGKRLHASET